MRSDPVIHPRPAAEPPSARSGVLVYGDLAINDADEARVTRLFGGLVRLPIDAQLAEVRAAFRRCRYLIFNNVDVNPLLPDLVGAELGVLAATGYSFVDVERATALGVTLANLPDYSAISTVEYMLWAAFQAARPLNSAAARVAAGRWDKAGITGRDLCGATAGVVGYGQIGRRLTGQLRALGMEVLVNTRRPRPVETGRWVTLDELAACANVLFVCCSITPETRGLVSASVLSSLRADTLLVSVSPNATLDLGAVARWLGRNSESRAVLDLDPLPADHPLLSCVNATITPHIAFQSHDSDRRRTTAAIETLEEHAAGHPVAWFTGTRVVARGSVLTAPGMQARDRLLEQASSFYQAQALYAFVKLGVATRLASGPAEPAQLAAELDLAPVPLALLLEGLTASGLVRAEPGPRYSIEGILRDAFDPASPDYCGDLVLGVVEGSYAPWEQLARFVASGTSPVRLQHLRENSPIWTKRLFRASHQTSRPVADALAGTLREHGRFTRILDVGAGPATLARLLLAYEPSATATLVDRAAVLRCIRAELEPEIARRVILIDQDMKGTAPLPAPADLVILSNVVHCCSPSELPGLLARAAAALSPGGVLVIITFLADGPDPAHCFAAHFSLSCALFWGDARTYAVSELEPLLASCALKLREIARVGQLTVALIAVKDQLP